MDNTDIISSTRIFTKKSVQHCTPNSVSTASIQFLLVVFIWKEFGEFWVNFPLREIPDFGFKFYDTKKQSKEDKLKLWNEKYMLVGLGHLNLVVHDTILVFLWTRSIYWCHDNEKDHSDSLTGHRLEISESLNPSYVT